MDEIQRILAMMGGQGPADAAGDRLRELYSRQGGGLANPGQGPGGLIRNPSDAQRHAMMTMALGMMSHNPQQQNAGQALQEAYQGGMSALREGRQAEMAPALMDYQLASDEEERQMARLGAAGDLSSAGSGGDWTYGSTERFVDEEGNNYLVTRKGNKAGKVEPVVTPVGGAPAEPVGRLQGVDSSWMTPEGRAEEAFSVSQRTNAAESANAALEDFQAVRKSISNIDQALAELERGANTGPITDLLPTFDAATKNFRQATRKMGLDVVGAVQFGALSEGELRLALETGFPTGLEEGAAREKLLEKRNAQVKLLGELQRAAQAMEGGMLPSQYMEQMMQDGRYVPAQLEQKSIDSIVSDILGS